MCGSGLVYIVYLDLRLPLCVLYMILYAACSGGMGEWDQGASDGQGWKVAPRAGVFLLCSQGDDIDLPERAAGDRAKLVEHSDLSNLRALSTTRSLVCSIAVMPPWVAAGYMCV